MNYTYDSIGQLLSANGYETDGTVQRRNEWFSYAYDAGGNLTQRWNDSLRESRTLGARNLLTSATPTQGTPTISGMAGGVINSLTVNGAGATIYSDQSFVVRNLNLAGSYTASAQGAAGNTATDTIGGNWGGTVNLSYDGRGSLISDGQRSFTYDDENQLIQGSVSQVE